MSELLAILRASRWGRWAGLALIILAAVGLGWGGWMVWSTRAESHGAVALAQARFLLAQAQTPNAVPEAKERAQKALEDVVAEYPRLSSGAQAAYQLGNLVMSRIGPLQAGFAESHGNDYALALARRSKGCACCPPACGSTRAWRTSAARSRPTRCP